MSLKILEYALDSLTPANPDGSCPATVTGCAVVVGPGATLLGHFPSALGFGGGGQLKTKLPLAKLNATKFCLRIVFKLDTPVVGRQVLAESNALPLALSLQPGSGTSDFHLAANVTTRTYGPGQASTEFLFDLHFGTWYTVDLVYDTDTLAAFVNGLVQSVHAFPDGTLADGSADQLTAGIAGNGTDFPFAGAMAALQLHDDIPIELEAQLDERRAHPQWYLTYKQEEIKSSLGFGHPVGEFVYDPASESWIQRFAVGLLMFHETMGQAFEMHGNIQQAYEALPNRAVVGHLVSDQVGAAVSGGRKSLFSRGGIYWSSATGAIPVIGQIWVDYEGLGEAAALGLPTGPATAVSGGTQQNFQQAQMYLRAGATKAFEVNGAILAKYLASGGPAVWGFPVSNEQDVQSGSSVIGRVSEFEGCTIYWSAGTGAFEVHGDIRDKYRSLMGPSGDLGFPISDEGDVPLASAPARYNTFRNGSIVWFGSPAETYVCVAFDITLGRIDTKESEAWYKGQNDVYMHATISNNGHVIHAERIPQSGDSDDSNIYDYNRAFDLSGGIVPNDPNCNIVFSLDVWDSDWPDDDDHLGTLEATLNMANAWGLRNNRVGTFKSGPFDNINSITWAVSPHVDETSLTEAQKWWGVKNRGTDKITYHQYASAFSDIDSETEWWDPTDWLADLFYSAVIEGLAKDGNCFGMSLEAIYSKKDRSLLRLPLDRFGPSDWEAVRNEFNIKHLYQVGAPAVWWFVGEFLSGKTHDPISVFHATRQAFHLGCDPVLCISQNYDFSGAPHCILPVGWDDSVTPWRILVHDPNFPTIQANDPGPRILNVDPGNNTYSYDGGGHQYGGGEWSGGRLHFMPFDLLNGRPRTPIFEALMLLVSGVILILASDSETASLTDENGVDLDAFGSDSVARLQAGLPLTNKFVSVKGADRRTRECSPERTGARPEEPRVPRRPRPHGVLTSELHMRSERAIFSRVPPTGRRGTDDWTHLTLTEYLCQVAPAAVRKSFAAHRDFVSTNRGRLVHRLLDSAVMKEILGAAASKAPKAPGTYPAISKNYIHTIRGLRGGRLQYGVKQGLSQFMLQADTAAGELHTVTVKDLGLPTSAISIQGSRDKVFSLVVHNKLGAGNDHLRMSVDRLPLTAGGELKINIKPGIGGLEVVSAGQTIQTPIKFEYLKRDTRLESVFEIQEQDGVRLVPSTFITAARLKVNRIKSLLGDPLSSRWIQPMP